jgi:hypothetical protein
MKLLLIASWLGKYWPWIDSPMAAYVSIIVFVMWEVDRILDRLKIIENKLGDMDSRYKNQRVHDADA